MVDLVAKMLGGCTRADAKFALLAFGIPIVVLLASQLPSPF